MRALRRSLGCIALACALGGCALIETGGAPKPPTDTAYPRTFTGTYMAATMAERSGATETARLLYNRALSVRPLDQRLLERSFGLALRDGDVAAASYKARVLRSLGEGRGQHALTLAVAAFADGDYQKAENALQATFNPIDRMAAQIMLVHLAAARGKTDLALRRLNEGETAVPIAGITPVAQAFILQGAGREDTAFDAWKAVAGVHTNNAVVAEAYGRFLERREAEAALTYYQDRLAIDGGDPVALSGLARLDRRRKPRLYPATPERAVAVALAEFGAALAHSDPHYALGFWGLASYLDPDFGLAHIYRGEIFGVLGEHENAAEAYSRVPDASAFSPAARLSAAAHWHVMGKGEAAYEALEARFPRSYRTEAHIRRGDIHVFNEDHREALDAYLEAEEDIDETHPAWDDLVLKTSFVLEALGRLDEAEERLRAALQREPDNPSYLNHLGYILIDHERDVQAGLAMAKRAFEMRPEDGNILDSVAWGYFKLGDYEQAATLLEEAAELEPHNAVIIDHLGDAYWKTGRVKKARAQWELALTLEPDAQLAALLRDKIEHGLPDTRNTLDANDLAALP
jgi:tetratricopeptide (TPR) repeat protein